MAPGSADEIQGRAAGGAARRRSAPARFPTAVRVLVVDDDPLVRRAIADLVSSDDSLELVGVASDADEAVRLGADTRPDVALVDVNMPGGGGARAARELRQRSPITKVLALSGSADREGVLQMLGSGAAGYMVKGANVDVVQGILAASRGEGVISEEVAADVIQELSEHLARKQEQHDQDESLRLRVARMKKVVEEREFTTAFQPIFDLRSGTVSGVEALARFSDDPSDSPDRWFAEAWALGLGIDLELVAVSSALAAAGTRPADLFLSINVSPHVTMTSSFTELLSTHRDTDALVVELTEHAVVEDYGRLTESLDSVRRRGVRVAVDDAGAGYASLRHILCVKPDLIKLDVSLISGIDDDRAKLALAAGLTSFAREMGTEVIAEGVETAAQLECLARLGVDYAQGHHLGSPTTGSSSDLWSPYRSPLPSC